MDTELAELQAQLKLFQKVSQIFIRLYYYVLYMYYISIFTQEN